jgi:hypothetical protein
MSDKPKEQLPLHKRIYDIYHRLTEQKNLVHTLGSAIDGQGMRPTRTNPDCFPTLVHQIEENMTDIFGDLEELVRETRPPGWDSFTDD